MTYTPYEPTFNAIDLKNITIDNTAILGISMKSWMIILVTAFGLYIMYGLIKRLIHKIGHITEIER
jgi:hypothetical protein